MKKQFYIIAVCLLCITAGLSAQSAAPVRSEEEVKSMLCHKWQIKALNVAGENLPMETADLQSFITYFKDGTFKVESPDGTEKDKWIYNHKNMTIKSSDVVKKILSVTEKELVVSITTDGMVTKMTLTRVD